MYKERERLLRELMAVDFTTHELKLYLDTHPCDYRTIQLYNQYVQRGLMLRKQYESMYGPLTANFTTSKFPWQWASEPWPWDKEVL